MNGWTYAGQYPCDGWVDNPEPTLLLPVICFLIQVRRQSEENYCDSLINHLQDKNQLVRTENRINDIFSEKNNDLSC